jgi:hypothetical protein
MTEASDIERALPVPEGSVVYKAVADGAVLFSGATEVYFGLNAVGAQVWELLPPATTRLDDLVAEMARRYPEVGVDELRADILELLRELEDFQLVVSPARAGGARAAVGGG